MTLRQSPENGGAVIAAGRAALGIELGSTRIKACLVDADDPGTVLATASHAWESTLADGLWSYSLDDVWRGVQAAYAGLVADAEQRHGTRPATLATMGVAAMMHGYLAFDATGELLVPFRTWRNTNTGPAATALSALFETNIPLRWSVAHLAQAVQDAEPHLPHLDFLTTLAGYVHWRLTGRRVLGVGDASGMFPIDPATDNYDAELIARFDTLGTGVDLHAVLPEVLVAGCDAGRLTAAGALQLDPTGALKPGIPLCPPEGDAGTGMVATNAVAPRSGNVSAGTSIFAMVVLERSPAAAHAELDIVTTPAGNPVAMVHCNNGASELAAWAGVFARFAAASGAPLGDDAVFDVLLNEALDAEPDAGGILAYNQVAGEPVAGLAAGRPLVVRTPDSSLTLANLMRAHVHGVFAALAIGMRVLDEEGIAVERLYAHGGVFRTAGVAQRLLAAAVPAPVLVGGAAAEGGAWGMAVLAAFARYASGTAGAQPPARGDLAAYLDAQAFRDAAFTTVQPDPDDVAGFAVYLDRYRAGLAIERAAALAL